MRLSDSQRHQLRELVRRGELWAGCTNPTLCALERRGLAKWEVAKDKPWERWTPTAAGLAAVSQ